MWCCSPLKPNHSNSRPLGEVRSMCGSREVSTPANEHHFIYICICDDQINGYSLGMIMCLVLTYRFSSIGAVEVKWRGRERDGEKDVRRNWSAASLGFYCICGQALSFLRPVKRLAVFVVKQTWKRVKVHICVCLYNCTQGKTKKMNVQHGNDYQDVHYEYIR